jgi:hypothetical protein
MSDERCYPRQGAYPVVYDKAYPQQMQPHTSMVYGHQPGYPSCGAASAFGNAPFGNVVEMGKIGAVVGLCGAAALNLHRLQAGEVDRRDAALDTLRGGAIAGVATAAATLVGSRFGSDLLGLAATLATGTAVVYALTAETPPDAAVVAADAAGKA